jgi:hypothetical protein
MSDQVLHIIENIRASKSGREISGYLLRIPDAIVVTHGAQLQLECVAGSAPFAAGAKFIAMREASLSAVRDAHGMLPDGIAFELEAWRHTLSNFSAGRTPELPTFMGENGGSIANQA